MKRGLVFTLCALALAASATVGRAQTVDLTLNLRYNDPNTPASGGNWYLLGKTTGGTTNLGIAGVSVFLDGVSTSVFHGSGVPLGAGQSATAHAYPAVGQATINNLTNGGNPFNGTFTGSQNVVYGQDLSIAGIISGVGQGGAGNVASDPLKNATYNNYSLLLSGTFTTAWGVRKFTPLEQGHGMPIQTVVVQIQNGKKVPIYPAKVAEQTGGSFRGVPPYAWEKK